MIYLIDTGPLVSALATKEPRFGDWAKNIFRQLSPPFYTCEPVITEASHFLGSARAVLELVNQGLLLCPWILKEHSTRVSELLQKYSDQRMDLADACLVAMSEKWWDCMVITIDERDFKAYRRRSRHQIPLLTPWNS